MYAVRLWSVRHARGMNAFYRGFEGLLVRLHPVWQRIGYARIEKPVAIVGKGGERLALRLPDVRPMRAQLDRHVVFDELPQNAAQRPLWRRAPERTLRNYAEHEVRVGGSFRRSQRMREGKAAIQVVQFAVDRRLQGQSSWLSRCAREKSGERS
jgi:hypothetical protein